nr:uncharacterized protein LOC128673871 [Plodia interpunctella]
MILKVLHFFEEEKLHGIAIPISQVEKRVCTATGISRRTLARIKNEEKEVLEKLRLSPQPGTSSEAPTETVKLPTPGKKRKQKKKLEIDDFMICAIKTKIESFYDVYKEVPTLKKILNVVKRDLNFPGQRETLRKIITESLGFKFKKCSKKRDVLIERPEIAAWRARYLRRLKENDDLGPEKKPVIFTDETWVHSHYTVNKCWQSQTVPGIRKNDSAGQRWIIVHAGGETGFVEGADLLYKCKSSKGDYHDEMDTENYTKWLTEKLIPNLPPNSIVVIDNAPYHSKQLNKPPTMAARKQDMQNWLSERNITFDPRMTKAELNYIIIRNRPEKEYLVDKLLEESGHEVLRLPPYQCDLNPIEYIWNLVKQRVADKNVDQSERQIEKLAREAIQSITQDDWKKEINHVDRLRKAYWEKQGLEDARELVINVNDDSDDSDLESHSDFERMSGIEELDSD